MTVIGYRTIDITYRFVNPIDAEKIDAEKSDESPNEKPDQKPNEKSGQTNFAYFYLGAYCHM